MDHQVKVNKETTAECRSMMRARKSAEKEHRQAKRGEARLEQEEERLEQDQWRQPGKRPHGRTSRKVGFFAM